MNQITYKIEGVAPLLMQSDVLANPLSPQAKELKRITEVRKKTDEHHLKMAELQFLGGLYYDDKNGYHMPAKNIFACLLGASKMSKLGTTWKQAALISEDAKLKFKHEKLSPKQLFELGENTDVRMVVVNKARIPRCRPIFHEWALQFTIWYDPAKLQEEQIDQIVDNAGKYVSLGTYRPLYGRFTATKVK